MKLATRGCSQREQSRPAARSARRSVDEMSGMGRRMRVKCAGMRPACRPRPQGRPPPAERGQAFMCAPAAPGRGAVRADDEMELPVRMLGAQGGQGLHRVDPAPAAQFPRRRSGPCGASAGARTAGARADHAQAVRGRGGMARFERGLEGRDDEDAVRLDAVRRGLEEGGVAGMRRVEAPAEKEDLHAMIVPNLAVPSAAALAVQAVFLVNLRGQLSAGSVMSPSL